mmetsp:Transcript_63824/g.197650  ORF Transcript_63824/g.197650 Transcript_63824/m.197650 type:complete len:252 (-) Transcript_63824:51-806(-)
MVGALFLKASIVYYCEGFWAPAAPPVHLLSLYYLSNACAVVYLLLGVWLAMHASVCSHSHGTKLLTRFIRLPIPGSTEMNKLASTYADYEKQGFWQMIRLPFLRGKDGKVALNEWLQKQELEDPDTKTKKKSDHLSEGVKGLAHDEDNVEQLLQRIGHNVEICSGLREEVKAKQYEKEQHSSFHISAMVTLMLPFQLLTGVYGMNFVDKDGTGVVPLLGALSLDNSYLLFWGLGLFLTLVLAAWFRCARLL